jgi:hypothetical protein
VALSLCYGAVSVSRLYRMVGLLVYDKLERIESSGISLLETLSENLPACTEGSNK